MASHLRGWVCWHGIWNSPSVTNCILSLKFWLTAYPTHHRSKPDPIKWGFKPRCFAFASDSRVSWGYLCSHPLVQLPFSFSLIHCKWDWWPDAQCYLFYISVFPLIRDREMVESSSYNFGVSRYLPSCPPNGSSLRFTRLSVYERTWSPTPCPHHFLSGHIKLKAFQRTANSMVECGIFPEKNLRCLT